MTKRNIKVDFSELENLKFKCIKYCGKCCFYQAATLTTAGMNRIRNFLETRGSEEFEGFVFDCLTYLNMLLKLNEEMIKTYTESLKWFWSPFQLDEAEEGILVRNYMIHSMPSTGRCKFLNPIDFTCFIYPARPVTCRTYPFTFKTDNSGIFKIVVAMENCPGLGIGSPLNQEEFKEDLQRSLAETRKDVEVYERYNREKGIKRTRRIKRKGKKPRIRDIDKEIREFEESWREQYFSGKKGKLKSAIELAKGKKFIEPFAELGLIPSHPLLVLWNKKIEKEYKK